MKKLTLILLALVGVVSFNSCKDDEPEQPTPATTNIFTELKGYTGKTFQFVSSTIRAKGFNVLSFDSIEEMRIYYFANSDNSYKYSIGEYDDTVFAASYEYINDNKNLLLTNYEKNSQTALSFVGNSPLLYYSSDIAIMNSEEGNMEFNNRADYLTAYNQNKDSINYCSESWVSQTAIVGTEFNYDEFEGHYSMALYGDMLRMPIMIEKAGNKSIFDLLKYKK